MYDLVFTSCPYIEGHIDLFIKRKTFQHDIIDQCLKQKFMGILKKSDQTLSKTYKYMYKKSICNYKTSRRKRFSSLWISSMAYNSFMEKSRASPQFSPFVFPLALLTELACMYSRNIHLSLFLPRPVVNKQPWKKFILSIPTI